MGGFGNGGGRRGGEEGRGSEFLKGASDFGKMICIGQWNDDLSSLG